MASRRRFGSASPALNMKRWGHEAGSAGSICTPEKPREQFPQSLPGDHGPVDALTLARFETHFGLLTSGSLRWRMYILNIFCGTHYTRNGKVVCIWSRGRPLGGGEVPSPVRAAERAEGKLHLYPVPQPQPTRHYACAPLAVVPTSPLASGSHSIHPPCLPYENKSHQLIE